MPIITKAVQVAGSQAELARRLRIKPQAVQQWVSAGRIPERRALDVQEATNGAVTALEILESQRSAA